MSSIHQMYTKKSIAYEQTKTILHICVIEQATDDNIQVLFEFICTLFSLLLIRFYYFSYIFLYTHNMLSFVILLHKWTYALLYMYVCSSLLMDGSILLNMLSFLFFIRKGYIHML